MQFCNQTSESQCQFVAETTKERKSLRIAPIAANKRLMNSSNNVLQDAIKAESAFVRLRDIGNYSSRNTSKGALLNEAFLLFKTMRENGSTVAELRESALRGQAFPRASYENRQRIWDSIHHRYFAPNIPWVSASLSSATVLGVGSPDFVSLAYLYYSLRDSLTFAVVTEVLWKRWLARSLAISGADVLDFLDGESKNHPAVKKWSSSTRTKLASSILAALRDFRVLNGIYSKQIQRPTVSPETVFHLLCILIAEGRQGRAVIEAPDWHLFLWSEDDAAKALADLAQRRWIRFERGGRTVILELIRNPEVHI